MIDLRLLRSHWLVRGASWVILGRGVSFFVQATYFLLLARLLSAYQYGVFSGCFALVSIVTPYSALGAGMLFMRYTSHNREQAGSYWGNALVTVSGMTIVLGAILALLGPKLTGVHEVPIFILLAVANCLFGQIPLLAATVFQSFEKLYAMSALTTLTNVIRLLALLVMKWTFHHATALQWTEGVTLASFISMLVALVCIQREVGPISFDFPLLKSHLREGLGFSVSGTAAAAHNDIDKTVLSHYGMNIQNGFYTLAYKIVDYVCVPVNAIDIAALPRFFKLSRQDRSSFVRLLIRSVALSALLGAIFAVVLSLCAPLLNRLVTHSYDDAISVLKLLCLLPLLRGLHSVPGSALTATGRQGLRTILQFGVAGFNLIGNVILVPRLGWVGAAYMSIASDGLLAVLNIGAVWLLIGRSSPVLPVANDPTRSILG
jgi:O-antigen/teichoic acid export membrane protein